MSNGGTRPTPRREVHRRDPSAFHAEAKTSVAETMARATEATAVASAVVDDPRGSGRPGRRPTCRASSTGRWPNWSGCAGKIPDVNTGRGWRLGRLRGVTAGTRDPSGGDIWT